LYTTHLVVHPSYTDALNLQGIVIDKLDDSIFLQKGGLLTELPDAINLSTYYERLNDLIDN
jgi:hypothetical protein